MTNRSNASKDARRLEKLYQTKEYGTKHSTVLRLIQERGLAGAMRQLEAWGMTPSREDVKLFLGIIPPEKSTENKG